MAETDEYIQEAYDVLDKLSADQMKRLEYEAREKALRDHNHLMKQAQRMGMEQGLEEGMERGIKQGMKSGKKEQLQTIIQKMFQKGLNSEQIGDLLDLDLETVKGYKKRD